MTYKEYEEMKIQEAVEIAQGILDGTVKTIPFKVAMKQLNKHVRKIEREQKREQREKARELKLINKGGMNYTL